MDRRGIRIVVAPQLLTIFTRWALSLKMRYAKGLGKSPTPKTLQGRIAGRLRPGALLIHLVKVAGFLWRGSRWVYGGGSLTRIRIQVRAESAKSPEQHEGRCRVGDDDTSKNRRCLWL
jgi:hypothetical protein